MWFLFLYVLYMQTNISMPLHQQLQNVRKSMRSESNGVLWTWKLDHVWITVFKSQLVICNLECSGKKESKFNFN